jgi:hypothetical protein
MNIKVKYHIEVGNEIIECETLEQAEHKMKGLSEIERYLIKTEISGDKVINQYLLG